MSRVGAFVLLSVGGGLAGFIWWCVLDIIVVRVLPYPERVHDFDWLIFAFPLGWFVVAMCVFRSSSIWSAIPLAAGATVLASLLALMPIFHFGIGFHLSIGGQL